MLLVAETLVSSWQDEPLRFEAESSIIDSAKTVNEILVRNGNALRTFMEKKVARFSGSC